MNWNNTKCHRLWCWSATLDGNLLILNIDDIKCIKQVKCIRKVLINDQFWGFWTCEVLLKEGSSEQTQKSEGDIESRLMTFLKHTTLLMSSPRHTPDEQNTNFTLGCQNLLVFPSKCRLLPLLIGFFYLTSQYWHYQFTHIHLSTDSTDSSRENILEMIINCRIDGQGG